MIINTVFIGSSIRALNGLPATTVPRGLDYKQIPIDRARKRRQH